MKKKRLAVVFSTVFLVCALGSLSQAGSAIQETAGPEDKKTEPMSDIFLTLPQRKEKPSEDSLLQRVASVQKNFHPGAYLLQARVHDLISGISITREALFQIVQ